MNDLYIKNWARSAGIKNPDMEKMRKFAELVWMEAISRPWTEEMWSDYKKHLIEGEMKRCFEIALLGGSELDDSPTSELIRSDRHAIANRIMFRNG